MSLEEIINKAVDDAVNLGLNARKEEYDTLKASHAKLVKDLRAAFAEGKTIVELMVIVDEQALAEAKI